MYDVALAREILRQILWPAHTMSERFQPIKSAYDFTDSDRGREKLDAICMQLIAMARASMNNGRHLLDARCWSKNHPWKTLMSTPMELSLQAHFIS